MWETIGKVLTSSNAIPVIIFLAFFTIVLVVLSKKGFISINRGGLRIGADEKERTIIRNQSQAAYLYVMSIKGKVLPEDPTKEQRLITELMLEKVYDNVVNWINYNHINSANSYIEIKQSEIKCLVYSQDHLEEEYKTEEFAKRMEGWVEELILNLIQIRKEYTNN